MPSIKETENGRWKGISLIEFEQICIRNLRLEVKNGLADSGSAGAGIVGVLVERFNFDPDKAVKTMQDWEKKAGYKRG